MARIYIPATRQRFTLFQKELEDTLNQQLKIIGKNKLNCVKGKQPKMHRFFSTFGAMEAEPFLSVFLFRYEASL